MVIILASCMTTEDCACVWTGSFGQFSYSRPNDPFVVASLDRDENDHQEEGLTQGDDGHAQSRPGIMHQFLDIHTRSFSHHEQLVFFVLFCIFLFLSLLFV